MRKISRKVLLIIFTLLITFTAPYAAVAEEQKPSEPPKVEQPKKAEQTKPVEQKVEEDKVTGEVAVSTLSAYILRGYEQTRNSIVIEPTATLNYKGFSVNVWGNWDTKPYATDNSNYAAKYTETDYTLTYTKKFGILQVTPGYVYYALGATNAGAVAPQDMQEVFLNLALETFLSPTFTVYKEIDHYHEWYFLFGISHTFELSKMIGLKLAATVSYLKGEDINEANMFAKFDSNSQPTKDKYNNFHDGSISAYLPIAITKSITVTPTISYVFPLCDDARYEMKYFGRSGVATGREGDRDSTYLYGGVTLSYAF